MVSIHIGGAESIFESGGQWRGRKWFVVNIEKGRGWPWGTWSGSGLFRRGKEGVRVAIPDKFEMGERLASFATYMPQTWLNQNVEPSPGAARRHRHLAKNYTEHYVHSLVPSVM